MSHDVTETRPRAVLAGVQLAGVPDDEHAASLAELGRLVHTLGYDVIGTVSQKRAKVSSGAIFGDGKLRELARYTGGPGKIIVTIPGRKKKKTDEEDGEPACPEPEASDETDDAGDEPVVGGEGPPLPEAKRAAFVIFDNELTPSQLRNLESATDVEVLDRTGVIVEIFYRHAKTRESRLQVEIARLKYLAPRLKMQRGATERQGSGVGAKGVGETAVEIDKRRIRDRIAELGRELEDIHASQSGRRERRHEQATVALVGYTNAGKSSLMRALTGSEVLVQDKLFATLDTTVRALHPETVPRVLVSDTVGFIKKLPHDLVASFRSTLDEAHDASLLLYVADASDATFRSQLEVTRTVIGEIGADAIRSLLILNKCDRLEPLALAALRAEYPDALQISAHRPADVQRLRETIIQFFERSMAEVDLHVPYAQGAQLGEIRRVMRVLGETHDDTGTTLRVMASPEMTARFAGFLRG